MTMEWTLILVVVIGLASLFAAYKVGGSTKEGRIDTLARALDSEVERAESLTKALAAMENSRNQQAWARKEQVALTTKVTDERDELIRGLNNCSRSAAGLYIQGERFNEVTAEIAADNLPDWIESALALVKKYQHYVPGIVDYCLAYGGEKNEMDKRLEGDKSAPDPEVTGDGTNEAMHTDFLMENNPKGKPSHVKLAFTKDSDDV